MENCEMSNSIAVGTAAGDAAVDAVDASSHVASSATIVALIAVIGGDKTWETAR
jgi:hypothetical protein